MTRRVPGRSTVSVRRPGEAAPGPDARGRD